jgi:maleamate amidohydrolase
MANADTDLKRNYAEAFIGHLSFGTKPAVLVVDMVMAYYDPNSPLFIDCQPVLDANVELVTAARHANVPVIFTNVVYRSPSHGGLFYKKLPALKAFDAGSPLGAFTPQLSPQLGDHLVTKQYASAFFATGLADLLTDLTVDTLLIAGVTTSGCVRASALDALQCGFVPFVVRDACGDRHPMPHEASLFDLQAKYAEVIGLQEALDRLAAA